MSFKEWKTYRLCEIPLEIIDGDRGKNYPKQDEFSSNGYCLFLNTGNVSLNGFNFSKTQFITKSKDTVLNKGKLKRDDVVLTTRGTLGNIGYFSSEIPFDNIRINSGMVILRNRDENELNTKYLYQYLKSSLFKDQVISFSSGSAQPQLPIKDLREIEITLPTVKIQQNIASILFSLDDKIELNRQTNQTLEGIAQTLFQEMCVPKEEELPEGWRVGKLGEICEVNKNSLNKKLDSPEWIDYIEISEVSKGIIGNVTRYLLGEEPSRAKRKLKHGDTVLSTVRPDRGSYFLAINPPTTNIVSTGFAVFSATKVPYTFLYVFLTNETSLTYYGQVANGGAYPAINPNVIMDMDLIIPKETVLNEYHKVAEPLFLQYFSNEQENQTLIALRDSLLPKLMKGEIEI